MSRIERMSENINVANVQPTDDTFTRAPPGSARMNVAPGVLFLAIEKRAMMT